MKTQLNLKQTQKLQLTPQLRQMISLLNLSSLELSSTIDEMLQDNPLLERVETLANDKIQPNETLTAAPSHTGKPNEYIEQDAFANLAEESNFYQHLHQQVCEWVHNERTEKLLHILIDSLNEQGFLTTDLDEIIEYAPLEWMLEEAELTQALNILYQFDPPGVAAENPQHSLLLQLKRLPESELNQCAINIVQNHFHTLAQINFIHKIKKEIHCDEYQIQAAIDLIKTLRPYPCSGFSGSDSTAFVKPDIRVHKDGERWVAQAEPHLLPVLRIREDYEKVVKETDDELWKNKLTEAKNFIENLELRENTIVEIAQIIVEKQQNFFELGEAALEPMQHADITAVLNIHQSTVSRSIRQKYLICPQGLYELNYFFSQAVGKHNPKDNDAMSNKAVKACLQEWLSQENPHKPYSDEELRLKLHTIGIDLARRTVAKYREELGFSSMYHRKQKL